MQNSSDIVESILGFGSYATVPRLKVLLFCITMLAQLAAGAAQLYSTTTIGGPGQSTTTIGIKFGPTPQVCATLAAYNTITQTLYVAGLLLLVAALLVYMSPKMFPKKIKTKTSGYAIGLLIGGVVALILSFTSVFFVQLFTGYPANELSVSAIQALGCNTVSVF